MVFMLVYPVLKNPRWLFNPSDYDPSVQNKLFKHDQSISEAYITQLEAAPVEVGDGEDLC